LIKIFPSFHKHQVLSKEVEEFVFEDEPLVIKGSQGTCYVFGQTNADRYLFVVVVLLSNQRARVITARDMIKRERRYYQQRR